MRCQSALTFSSSDLWICHDNAAFKYVGLQPALKGNGPAATPLTITLCFQHAWNLLIDMLPALEARQCTLEPIYVPTSPVMRCAECYTTTIIQIIKPATWPSTYIPAYCPNCGGRTLAVPAPESDFFRALAKELGVTAEIAKAVHDVWLQYESSLGGNFLVYARNMIAETLTEIEQEQEQAQK